MRLHQLICRQVWIALVLATPSVAFAFAAYVVPARIELVGTPGQISRQVLDIGNDGATGEEFSIKTADWLLTRTGGVEFETNQLANNSCRPWVQLERLSVKLPPRGKRRFRFEVHVPTDASPQECRFALLIESASEVALTVTTGGLRFPIAGRIGVIVYLRIGDVAPQLKIDGIRLDRVNGLLTPVIDVHNTGSAHGRLDGVLEGTSLGGKRMEFSLSNFPILPGEKRTIVASVNDTEDGKKPDWQPPLKLKGDIEWRGGKWPVDVELVPPK